MRELKLGDVVFLVTVRKDQVDVQTLGAIYDAGNLYVPGSRLDRKRFFGAPEFCQIPVAPVTWSPVVFGYCLRDEIDACKATLIDTYNRAQAERRDVLAALLSECKPFEGV